MRRIAGFALATALSGLGCGSKGGAAPSSDAALGQESSTQEEMDGSAIEDGSSPDSGSIGTEAGGSMNGDSGQSMTGMDSGGQMGTDSGDQDSGGKDSGGSMTGKDSGGSMDSGGSVTETDSGTTGVDSGGKDSGGSTTGDSGSVSGIPGGQVGPGTTVAGCEIFPDNNPWNVAIDGTGVEVIHTYDSELPQGTSLHPDFGDYSTNHYGIPYNVVPAGQADDPTTFSLYANQSDPGPGGWVGTNPVTSDSAMGTTAYPFYLGMHIEGDPGTGGMPGDLPGDQHGIVLQQGASGCTSYEAWNCVGPSTASFLCANGAVFNLTSNALRPAGWTSGDLAGLSILAGIVKLAEVQSGTVTHAIRVTFNNTQSGYIPPATHAVSPGNGAGPLGSAYPPMGLRIRLKASTATSSYTTASQVIMAAMKKYGLMVADIGSDWYFQGDSDDGWAATAPDGQDTLIDEVAGDFSHLTGADFEVVYTGDPVSTGL
jgi:hypothetical protein